MSERKTLGKIAYHSDDDTGMYHAGEIDGGFDNYMLTKYLHSFGEKGYSELLECLARMTAQVFNAQHGIRQQNSEIENATKTDPNQKMGG